VTPAERIARFRALIRSASPEEMAEILREALRAMPSAEQAMEVCAAWADATDHLFALNAALLGRMAASGNQ
jgi:hypothetical protein